MGEFSLSHIILVLIIVLIFFGPSKLPQLGQSLGQAIRGFKEGMNEMKGEARDLPPKRNEELSHDHQAQSEQYQRETTENKKS